MARSAFCSDQINARNRFAVSRHAPAPASELAPAPLLGLCPSDYWNVAVGIVGSGPVRTIALEECDGRAAAVVPGSCAAAFGRRHEWRGFARGRRWRTHAYPSWVQMHHNALANLAHRTTLASRDEALVSTRGIPALLVVVQGGSGRSRDVGSCSAVVGEVRLLAGSSRSSGQQARCQVPLVLAEEQCAGSVAPVVDVERWVPGGALRSAGEQELHGETRAGAQNQQSWPRLLVSIGVSRGWQSQSTCRSCSSSAPGETGRGLFYRRSTLLELDHVFCMVSEPGQAARRLDEDGWMLDAGQTHHGQGTRNRRLAWAEQFSELVWVIDAAEAGANPLRLAGDRASPTCSGLPASWPR